MARALENRRRDLEKRVVVEVENSDGFIHEVGAHASVVGGAQSSEGAKVATPAGAVSEARSLFETPFPFRPCKYKEPSANRQITGIV
jgi:hypothetical protein